MAKGTAKTPATSRQRRSLSAVNLLIYLETYMKDQDIGGELPLKEVLDRLEKSIVTESKAKQLA